MPNTVFRPAIVDHERLRVSAFFSHLITELGETKGTPQTMAVCVAHLLPTADSFLDALNKIAPIRVLVPKPKSQDKGTIKWAKKALACRVLEADRGDDFPGKLLQALALTHRDKGKKVVFVDIGGYFAPGLEEIARRLAAMGVELLGVMEGTENGAQAYEKVYSASSSEPSVPILTVARSPLKIPEDYLVGAGIVFSIESILREHGQILQTRSACVIGFGRVGSAVAASLRGRGIPTIVNDVNAVKKAEAAAQGYQVYPNVHEAVARSSLIVSATSAAALDPRVLASIRSGAAVATVTSRDTEFSNEGKDLNDNYDASAVGPNSGGHSSIIRYDEKGSSRYFWLLNDGNAPNFLHGAILGPALQLIEGEKLIAVHSILQGAKTNRLNPQSVLSQVYDADRELVASTWNDHFIGT